MKPPSDPLSRRLILVTGTSSGAGKTALTAGLARALHRRGVPVHPLEEGTLLATPAFARFDQAIAESAPTAMAILLEAAQRLIAEHITGVLIVDALLPGCFWLFGRHPEPDIATFLQDLWALLQPLRPLTIYLQGDPDVLLARAGAERGPDWEEGYIQALGRWRLPHYAGVPLRNRDELIHYLHWLENQTLHLLSPLGENLLLLDAEADETQQIATVLVHLLVL